MRTDRTLASEIASMVSARENCEATGNEEWKERHTSRLELIQDNCLPHGSGVDCGCIIDLDKSKPNRLVIETSFHHMDEHGGYCGWSDHSIIITPSLQFGFNLRITGRDVRDIKDYLHELFQCCLEGQWTEYIDCLMQDRYPE